MLLKSKKCFAIFSFAIFIALTVGCGRIAQPTETSVLNEGPELTQEISASGEVIPTKWIYLSYPNGATDLEIKVSEGDQVLENELVAISNNPQLKIALYQAYSALSRAQLSYDQIFEVPTSADLAAAKSAVANAKANLARVEFQLSLDEVIEASEADVEAAEENLRLIQIRPSKDQIYSARYDVKAAEWGLNQAKQAINLKAPFSGTIVEVFVQNGEAIGVGQPVMTLANLNEFNVVTTDLSEVDVTKISLNQKAEIVFDALSDQTFTGTVTKIADRSSGTSSVYYEVTLTLDEIPEGLRWGMTAYIIFPNP